MYDTLEFLTILAARRLRNHAARLTAYPELAVELESIAEALEQANADRLAVEQLLRESPQAG